nr:response regulator [Paraflavitalea speifideiaquila]
MKVLLVEDEATVSAMIRKGLSESGYSVSVAPDGKAGLDMGTGHSFDVMILDIMLPGINGLNCAKAAPGRY